MKVDVNDKYETELKEVFTPCHFISSENDMFSVCMRDGGFEFTYNKKTYEAKNGKIKALGANKVNKEDIDNVYVRYPSKCLVKGSSTGKTSANKRKIKSLLSKTYTAENLVNIIGRYSKECVKDKVYMKNFGTFLNNIPDYSESVATKELSEVEKYTTEEERVGLSNDEIDNLVYKRKNT